MLACACACACAFVCDWGEGLSSALVSKDLKEWY